MTTIKASCPICGDVDLTPAQVRLVVSNRSELSHYAFDCPRCHDEVRRTASEEIVRALEAGGVPAQRLHVPDEALEDHGGAPLTYDDLLDLHVALAGHDRLVELLEASGSTY